ncbi:hypothetical protein BGX28_000054 [Mortierella sp. GBA30]|nr:hypothetical protein BGX28_000054 [Mortierella sp. GBA30]
MPVSDTTPSILPAGSLLRLKSLEDRIAYKYSQDRIDQGLDEDGNDIESYNIDKVEAEDDDEDDQVNIQWLLKLLVKLEETAPADDDDEDEEENNYDNRNDSATERHSSKDNHHADGSVLNVKARTTMKTESSQETEYRSLHEQLTERVSSCLAHFCGRAASGAMTRTWTFKTTPPQSLQIHDPSFTEGDVGFKTFGSAYLLSKHIAHGDIPQLEPWTSTTSTPSSPLPFPRILELGSGTGLVGFTASLFSNPQGPKVILSDYHPNVISTLHHNSALNHLENRCDIQLLDWRDVLKRRSLRNKIDTIDPSECQYDTEVEKMSEQDRMDLIIGAEVVYDHGHAELVAHVVDEYLKRDLISQDSNIALSRRRPAFHIMFPIRKTHADVIAEFDFWMDKMGLVDCREAKEWGREDGETKFLYHWREYVRREHLDDRQ